MIACWTRIREHLVDAHPSARKDVEYIESYCADLSNSVALYQAIESVGLRYIPPEQQESWVTLVRSHPVYAKYLDMSTMYSTGKSNERARRYMDWTKRQNDKNVEILTILYDWLDGTPPRKNTMTTEVDSVYNERLTPRGLDRCVEFIRLAPSMSKAVIMYAMGYVIRGELAKAYEFPLFIDASSIADSARDDWYEYAYPSLCRYVGQGELRDAVGLYAAKAPVRLKRMVSGISDEMIRQELGELTEDIRRGLV